MQAAIQHPNIPTRFVIGSDGHYDALCCPVCACPFVHTAEVVVEQGHTRLLSVTNRPKCLPQTVFSMREDR